MAQQKEVIEKTVTALVHATMDKMDAKLARMEVPEARLKGVETMIRAMEQTIDMLQRRR